MLGATDHGAMRLEASSSDDVSAARKRFAHRRLAPGVHIVAFASERGGLRHLEHRAVSQGGLQAILPPAPRGECPGAQGAKRPYGSLRRGECPPVELEARA